MLSSDPGGRAAAEEDNLDKLLAEASLAHDALDRLVQNRPPPTTLPGAGSSSGGAATGIGPLIRATTDAVRTGAQPPPELFGGVALSPRSAPAAPSLQSRQQQEPMVLAQLGHSIERLNATLGGRALSTSSLPSNSPDRALSPSSRQPLATAAHKARRADQRHDELSEARAVVRELRAENKALRGALDKQRQAERLNAKLRASLEDARRECADCERARVQEQRAAADLKFALREAEAERERLRTLLQGTIWSEYTHGGAFARRSSSGPAYK